MRHTKLLLYNRYTKKDNGEVTVKTEKVTRMECIADIFISGIPEEKNGKVTYKPVNNFDEVILQSDELFRSKNPDLKSAQEPNTPETYRLYRLFTQGLMVVARKFELDELISKIEKLNSQI